MKTQTKHRMGVIHGTGKQTLGAIAELLLKKKEEAAALENQIQNLRGHLIDSLGMGVHKVGDYQVTIDERERVSFDQAAMVEHFGEKSMAAFAKLTRYKTLGITQSEEG
jgi:hypothetical protein